jgi:hypothetical protein
MTITVLLHLHLAGTGQDMRLATVFCSGCAASVRAADATTAIPSTIDICRFSNSLLDQ